MLYLMESLEMTTILRVGIHCKDFLQWEIIEYMAKQVSVHSITLRAAVLFF